MASLYTPPPLSITANNAAPLSTFSSCSPFLIRNHKSKAPKVAKPSQYYASRVSCKATKEGDPEKHSKENNLGLGMFERRNILIGLGGLYGLSNDPLLSLADPILPPDFTKCVPATVEIDDTSAKKVECCPPVLSKPIDYKLPVNPRVKMRPAAQYVDATYIRNYKEAVRRMKALPDDDPRNFYQQAKVHCAYCNAGYQQVGFPNLELQVHDSWIFFPFHRWYLYFYERILGSLIKDLDPNFALPFWNWDSPDGMKMPAYYTDDPNSPLYDSLRNPIHLPPKFVDLDYTINEEKPLTPEEQATANLYLMYRTMVSGAKIPSLFFGGEYRAGNTDPGKAGRGTVENLPHGAVHRWTGGTEGLHEDLGNFYSAGRDPIFYSHHANIDRLWPVWKSLGGKRKDIRDRDWLKSGFLFYDENKNLVRVKVEDCLDTRKLGYDYEPVANPWKDYRPPKATLDKGRFQSAVKKKFGAGAGAPLSAETFQEPKFPLVLDSSTVSIVVKRPKKNRSKAEKEEEEEVLVIDGIGFERDLAPKFDIYINDEADVPGGPTKAEFAGSFVHVPHGHKDEKNNMKTRLRIGITDLLEDLGAEDDELLVVTLVPKFEKGRVTIEGIKIELANDDVQKFE